MKKHVHRRVHHHKQVDQEAGFFSLKELMNRNDKFIVLGISIGILVLIILSVVLVLSRGDDGKLPDELVSEITPTIALSGTPYPTVPDTIKDGTVIVNQRGVLPPSITIEVGGSIGFLNDDEVAVTIEGVGESSSILNLGSVFPYDVPVVVFPTAGTYQYQVAGNPSDIGEIIVTE